MKTYSSIYQNAPKNGKHILRIPCQSSDLRAVKFETSHMAYNTYIGCPNKKETGTNMPVSLKGACSDPQPHPPIFFKHMEILVPEVESYLEDCMCEVSCTNSL